jgi:hypothetical protein
LYRFTGPFALGWTCFERWRLVNINGAANSAQTEDLSGGSTLYGQNCANAYTDWACTQAALSNLLLSMAQLYWAWSPLVWPYLNGQGLTFNP